MRKGRGHGDEGAWSRWLRPPKTRIDFYKRLQQHSSLNNFRAQLWASATGVLLLYKRGIIIIIIVGRRKVQVCAAERSN